MEEAGWRSTPQQQPPSQEIDQVRHAIDSLDRTIATLLQQRLLLTCRIGQLKADSDIAVNENSREQKVLDNVQSVAVSSKFAAVLANIYRCVMSESCSLHNEIKQTHARQPSGATASTPAGKATIGFPRVLIVGVGLIGGAIGRQIKLRMPQTAVTGVDHQGPLEIACGKGLIDKGETELSQAVAKAGLILLCASPAQNLRLLGEIAPLSRRGQVIVDVSSTKKAICRRAENTTMKAEFIGGHPLFGSQKSGVAASDTVVVEGKRFCLVPTYRTSKRTMRRVERWLTELGVQVVHSQADEHDEALARTSHSVQMLSVALGNSLARGRSSQQLRDLLSLSAGSLQSLARLMHSPAGMWTDIARQNREQLQAALGELITELTGMREDLAADSADAIAARFAIAAQVGATLDDLNRI